MNLDPWNYSLKIWESIGTPIPKVRAHLRMWRFIPSHSLTLSRAWDVTHGLPSWPTPLQTFALIMSPRLGLQHDTHHENNLVLAQIPTQCPFTCARCLCSERGMNIINDTKMGLASHHPCTYIVFTHQNLVNHIEVWD